MITSIRNACARFWAEEDANILAEGVMILPFIALFYVGIVDYFQTYAAKATNIRAAYTISDILSREDTSVNANYINGLHTVFSYLTQDAGGNPEIRVTVVYCEDNCGLEDTGRVLRMDWSYGVGKSALVEGQLSEFEEKIPVMSTGDRALLVETTVDYTPAFESVGLEDVTFENIIVTRPRWVPIMCFEGINCNS